MEDPKVEQEAGTESEDHEELDAEGHPIASEITQQHLVDGVELEDDPWEIHKQDHPTPDHPTGRISP